MSISIQQLAERLSWIENRWTQLRGDDSPQAVDEMSAVSDAKEFFELLEALRTEEGNSVQIVSDNADFNGQPNCLIIFNGALSDWKDVRFTGDTVLECLRKARIAFSWPPAGAGKLPKPPLEVVESSTPFRELVLEFNKLVEFSNPYAYFELARTRSTEWMAFICDKPPSEVTGRPEPGRVILAQGQGFTPDEACAEALKKLNENVPV